MTRIWTLYVFRFHPDFTDIFNLFTHFLSEFIQLEKTARRIIPIPKAYYFQTGNTNIPLKTKAWHRTVQTLGTLLRWSEKIGHGVAKVTGLEESRFEDITGTMDKTQWEEAEKNAIEQKDRREKYLTFLQQQQAHEETAANAGFSSQAL
jgi:hypothetical protein